MAYSKDSEYLRGISDEHRVIKALEDKGRKVTKSTRDENIRLDIDCYVDGKAVSIKSQPSAGPTGRIVLELEVAMVKQRGTSPSDTTTEWVNSWFYNGMAELYLILIGDRLLLLDKTKLASIVESLPTVKNGTVGWVSQGNKPETVQRQFDCGHPHLDARNALIYIDYLVQQGVAKWFAMPKPKAVAKPILRKR